MSRNKPKVPPAVLKSELYPYIGMAPNEHILNMSAQNGEVEMVKYMVEEMKADVQNKGQSDWTPLLFACRGGSLPIVQYLIDRGATIDALGRDGWTAAHLAAESESKELVEFLLGKNPDFLEMKNKNNDTPLNRAAVFGRMETIEYLVEHMKANIENVGCRGRTPLMMAAAGDHLPVVEWLLDHGADIEAKGDSSDAESAAIHLAATLGHKQVVAFLIEKNADFLEVKDKNNNTPLNRAAMKGHLEVVNLLVVEKKAEVDNKGELGKTPLLLAAEAGHLPVAERLLANGADIEAKDSEENTILHLAARNGHADVAAYILTAKPGMLNAENVLCETALDIAKEQKKTNVVKVLEMANGKTPIHPTKSTDTRATKANLTKMLEAHKH